MEACPPALQSLLARVAAAIRLRRAERGAWRGAFWGALAAVLLLTTKGWHTGWDATAWNDGMAQFLALVLVAAAMAAGALSGASRRVQPLVSARLADRALGLQDRLSTALECLLASGKGGAQTPLSPMAAAQLADTVARVEQIDPKAGSRLVPRLLPREAKFLALPLAMIAALMLLPPLPAPAALMQSVSPDKAQEQRAVSVLDRVKMLGQDLLRRPQPEPQEARRGTEEPQGPSSDAQFQDKALKRQEGGDGDFASFAKKGDERLRLLERADKLPDLQSDFASSQARTLARKMGELASAKGGKMSDAKMGQILREMEKMGRKDNNAEWNEDLQNAMQAYEDGDGEGAMEGLQQALGKMQAAEDKQRASQLLNGGRDGTPDRNAPGGESGDYQRSGDAGFSDGKGGGPSQGAATARLRSTPYDAAISGARKGRAPTFDTGASSRPGSASGQLQYRGEIGQYRRQMEDAIAREQVPRDYHNQIRDYFKSLQE